VAFPPQKLRQLSVFRGPIKFSPNGSNETTSLYFLSERAADAVCLAAPRTSTTKPCAASAPAWGRDHLHGCMHRCTAGRDRRETSPSSPALWPGRSSGTKERYSLMLPFPQARIIMYQVGILVAVRTRTLVTVRSFSLSRRCFDRRGDWLGTSFRTARADAERSKSQKPGVPCSSKHCNLLYVADWQSRP
jgi:hypothetical protein